MSKSTCRVRVGRLMEIDVADGYKTVDDVDAMIDMIRAELVRVTPKQVVIAADWRPCTVFTQAVADRAVAMLTGPVPRIERSAILHSKDHATSGLQVFRLLKEAHFEGRRVFTVASEMEAWLEDILTPEERTRLHTFLSRRA